MEHGTDYDSVCNITNLQWLKEKLEETFAMKTVIAGHSKDSDVVKEAKHLNIFNRATPEGLEYESDQRHAGSMIE